MAKPSLTPTGVAPTAGQPTPRYAYIYTPSPLLAENADPTAPRIIEIDLNDRVLSALGPVRVRVLTNAMVSSVIARTLGHELALPQAGPGVFGADDRLPSIPFFLRNRTYNVDFIATTPNGRTTNITLPITIR